MPEILTPEGYVQLRRDEYAGYGPIIEYAKSKEKAIRTQPEFDALIKVLDRINDEKVEVAKATISFKLNKQGTILYGVSYRERETNALRQVIIKIVDSQAMEQVKKLAKEVEVLEEITLRREAAFSGLEIDDKGAITPAAGPALDLELDLMDGRTDIIAPFIMPDKDSAAMPALYFSGTEDLVVNADQDDEYTLNFSFSVQTFLPHQNERALMQDREKNIQKLIQIYNQTAKSHEWLWENGIVPIDPNVANQGYMNAGIGTTQLYNKAAAFDFDNCFYETDGGVNNPSGRLVIGENIQLNGQNVSAFNYTPVEMYPPSSGGFRSYDDAISHVEGIMFVKAFFQLIPNTSYPDFVAKSFTGSSQVPMGIRIDHLIRRITSPLQNRFPSIDEPIEITISDYLLQVMDANPHMKRPTTEKLNNLVRYFVQECLRYQSPLDRSFGKVMLKLTTLIQETFYA